VKRKRATDDPSPPESVDSDPPKAGKSQLKLKKKSGVHPELNVYKSADSSTTLMKREDPLPHPLRLAYPALNHHSRIFLKRQVPTHRNPSPLQPAVNARSRGSYHNCAEETD